MNMNKNEIFFQGTAYFNAKPLPKNEVKEHSRGLINNNYKSWLLPSNGVFRTENYSLEGVEIKHYYIVFQPSGHYAMTVLQENKTIKELNNRFVSKSHYAQAWSFKGIAIFNGEPIHDFIEFKEEGVFETPDNEVFLVRRAPESMCNENYSNLLRERYWELIPLNSELEILNAKANYCS